MIIVISYSVNAELFATAKHNILLATTEYKHGDDVFVYMKMGKRMSAGINRRFSASVATEQYLHKNVSSSNGFTRLSAGAFANKLKGLECSKTIETVVEYAYTNKRGASDMVQIVVTERDGRQTATIDFCDAVQYFGFVCPAWLEGVE